MSLSFFAPSSGLESAATEGSRLQRFTLPLLICAGLCILALAFAFYTDHRWEDWYITYRASKNVVLGNGLVFTAGERVHSFTSPIGTLIPALLAILTNANDEAVIWLFRVISSLALGAAVVQLLRITQALKFSTPVTVLLLGLFSTNMLIVDFTINGMETAFMMLFLAYFVRILVSQPQDLVKKLAFAMVALMYTRPDSFIYAGTIGLGFFIFQPQLNDAVRTRRDFLLIVLKAAAIALVFYLPWVLWTWSYYGSPIPHTIVAKSGSRHYGMNMVWDFLTYPYDLFSRRQVNESFLPPYAGQGWHPVASRVSWGLSLLGYLALIFAWRNPRARAISVGALLSSFYLNTLSGQNATPWYLPNLSIMIILVVALLLEQVSHTKLFAQRVWAVWLIVVALLANSLFVLAHGAHDMKVQQQVIEFGHRKQIGLYLHEHARSPKDTVFMECLGYIGFYSGLKTYDYPGMSSPESVASIKKFGPGAPYAFVINDLKPDWVVLRSFEIENAEKDMPGMLEEQYVKRQVFDASDKIPEDMLTREYLKFDKTFTVFERKR